MTIARPRSRQRPLIALVGLLLALFLVSLLIGRYPQPYWMSPGLLSEDALAQQLVFNLRLPRTILAVALGMALSGAGAVMQMIFRNPLVEPGFLGVSQGAAFGAALAIVFVGSSALLTQGLAAVFAFVGLALSYTFAKRIRFGSWVLSLILAGIAVSAFFSAGLGVLKYVADPLSELQTITFWLLGGLWHVTWRDVAHVLPVVIPALGVLHLMRWRVNLLSLSDETAFSLGIAPERERLLVLIAAVAATAAVVAVAGIVSWVGLIVPHIARRWLGADGLRMLPASMMIGGIFTLLCDNMGRTAISGEIPLGVVTALIGASLFVALMIRAPIKVRV